jgi:hypothetical protein
MREEKEAGIIKYECMLGVNGREPTGGDFSAD